MANEHLGKAFGSLIGLGAIAFGSFSAWDYASHIRIDLDHLLVETPLQSEKPYPYGGLYALFLGSLIVSGINNGRKSLETQMEDISYQGNINKLFP